ncbi:hypothetical protein U1Q18_009216 [Sarracenia purpurea var. burkii]
MMSEEAKVEIASYWDEGYNAFRKHAHATFPSIDISIIQLDEEEEPSYAEGDETTHGLVEGFLLSSSSLNHPSQKRFQFPSTENPTPIRELKRR